jgi:hypothetical protein
VALAAVSHPLAGAQTPSVDAHCPSTQYPPPAQSPSALHWRRAHRPWTQSKSAGHGTAEGQAAGSQRCEAAHVLPSGQGNAPSEQPLWQTVEQFPPQMLVHTSFPPSGAQSMSASQPPKGPPKFIGGGGYGSATTGVLQYVSDAQSESFRQLAAASGPGACPASGDGHTAAGQAPWAQ